MRTLDAGASSSERKAEVCCCWVSPEVPVSTNGFFFEFGYDKPSILDRPIAGLAFAEPIRTLINPKVKTKLIRVLFRRDQVLDFRAGRGYLEA